MALKHLLTTQGEAFSNEANPYITFYPRPQLKRDSFFSLNGVWSFTYYDSKEGTELTKDINVPFPPESLLSGVGCSLGKKSTIIYKRLFTLPKGFLKSRVILNLGAVSGRCDIFINSVKVTSHTGGYNSFSCDITEQIKESENEIEIYCHNDLSGTLPYGKQTVKRGGMWYTPASGIWQSIWIESVPSSYVKSLKITPLSNGARIEAEGIKNGVITLTANGQRLDLVDGVAEITVDEPVFWSPDNPHLYYFTLEDCEGDGDIVSSYFAIRTIEVKDIDGIKRICLNGKPIFFHGVLDQGYFSDGIYTPASPTLYEEDILRMKALGFNTLRKHIKIEPEWFYYDCDRLGMIVFQDMVNNGRYSFVRDTALPTVGIKYFPPWLIHRTREQRAEFLKGMKETVNQLYNHPCICYWTIFNEGWGQFSPEKMYEELSLLDKTRIIDSTSGWFKGKRSDVESIHVYFKAVKLKKADLPIVLSEYGGYCYKVEGHSANEDKTYAYKFFKSQAEFENALASLFSEEIKPLISKGLCGAIYTQLSDVEDETNGLITYDRRVVKVNTDTFKKIGESLIVN
ncbi:MAG: glycoside hydrolase family 2 [Clostridia bacterium]|nr:glycoside hydrolase family 2 [Clostridia bacterium]